jgi:hypothetical protein
MKDVQIKLLLAARCFTQKEKEIVISLTIKQKVKFQNLILFVDQGQVIEHCNNRMRYAPLLSSPSRVPPAVVLNAALSRAPRLKRRPSSDCSAMIIRARDRRPFSTRLLSIDVMCGSKEARCRCRASGGDRRRRVNSTKRSMIGR